MAPHRAGWAATQACASSIVNGLTTNFPASGRSLARLRTMIGVSKLAKNLDNCFAGIERGHIAPRGKAFLDARKCLPDEFEDYSHEDNS